MINNNIILLFQYTLTYQTTVYISLITYITDIYIYYRFSVLAIFEFGSHISNYIQKKYAFFDLAKILE